MINLFNDSRKQSAFTLIELLVVVAVLALLASIVFSNLTGAREQAKISNALSFQSNMHNLLGADLVGWWNFDEGNAKDISGYNNHGVITRTSLARGVNGNEGSALRFKGSADFVIIPETNDFFNFTQGDSFSYSSWFKVDSFPASWHGIISKSPSWGEGYNLQVGLTQNIACGIGAYVRTEWEPQLDIWYHAICSYDGNKMTLYVNGVEESSKSYNIKSGDTDLKLGMFYTTNSLGFYGVIDDVRIYSRALTAYEVQTLYAQTKDNYLAEEQ